MRQPVRIEGLRHFRPIGYLEGVQFTGTPTLGPINKWLRCRNEDARDAGATFHDWHITVTDQLQRIAHLNTPTGSIVVPHNWWVVHNWDNSRPLIEIIDPDRLQKEWEPRYQTVTPEPSTKTEPSEPAQLMGTEIGALKELVELMERSFVVRELVIDGTKTQRARSRVRT